MEFTSLGDMTARASALGAGPLLMLVCEDEVEIRSSLEHHLAAGYPDVILATPPGVTLPGPAPEGVHHLILPQRPDDMAATCVNALIPARPSGAWTAWCHNAEYLFHPFAETRRIGEAMAFCVEERRDAILTFTVDLYAGTPDGNGVDLAETWMDEAGYYALARPGPDGAKDRQLDVFGGLRWRFEEHVPEDRRRIDRVAMFRARPDLRLTPDHRMTDEEMNTYACPWHHSLTACTASFRAAKALATNPGSRWAIDAFRWDGSVRFEWRAQQLMDLGLMEPGQWF
ncbi:hypothetical protein JSE7799_00075 [Jannaschia seosinensis]|uniref:Glycosyl transferase family 2 n=1 Tax=Jannaschia seosinensis TaxID=313367 RepID=A0A0M7B7Q8_9RHOB|nr:hypothetical protein [Jannaschia seosinensis]CUH08725.1 hypothetical protein JSE7799_00075 [Jannaschia seosinensis]